MTVITHLDGWNVSVERISIQEKGENGDAAPKEGFALIFTEARPPTGNRIVFRMPKEVADLVANDLRGIQIFGPGEMPTL